MNLEKLFEAQRVLDERIEQEHPRNFDEDYRDYERIMALLVELGELANEWRGFKFWSNNRQGKKPVILEEYVDCLHFILSIGNERRVNDYIAMWFKDIKISQYGDHGILESFLNLFEFTSLMAFNHERSQFTYLQIMREFYGLGYKLGFTSEQVEKAYFDKNKINHQRLESGY